MHSEPGGVVEGARRAAKHTQSREESRRGPGGQPNTLRAGRSGGGRPGGQPNTLRAGRSGTRGSGGQPNTLITGRSGGGEPGGQPNTLRAAKHTQSRGERWRRARSVAMLP